MPERSNPESGVGPEAEGVEPQAASAVLEDLESLRHRVGAVEQQRDEYLALLQRTRADFENYQKRIRRDLDEERHYAHAALARELLPILDNLQRALDARGTHFKDLEDQAVAPGSQRSNRLACA